ncbi:MAG: protein kinase [Deltaproteobacteria bacterium]|nr:protein kinase [Deltaproteobacteria bacterium]
MLQEMRQVQDDSTPPARPPQAGASDRPAQASGAFRELGTRDVVGGYQVLGALGAGGMGTVYAAVHPVIGKKVAIKVLAPSVCTDPEVVERFVQEARSVNHIGHPNIVDVFAFGQLEDGRQYFVMEMLEGETLSDRLRRGKPTLAEAAEILIQVAEALEATHEAQIVHRDLKPANVFLVSQRGRQTVKLLDFGIAKLVCEPQQLPEHTPETRTGVVLGTPGFMSPEQCRGLPVGPAADVYALGAIAYELILGRPPFEAKSSVDLLLQHVGSLPPRPRELWPKVPSRLERLLLDMLAKEAADRPKLQEVRQVLADAAAEQPASPAPPATASLRGPITVRSGSALDGGNTQQGRRARAMLWGLAAMMLVAVVAGFAALRPTQEATPVSNARTAQPPSTEVTAPRPGEPAALPLQPASLVPEPMSGAPTQEPSRSNPDPLEGPALESKVSDAAPAPGRRVGEVPRRRTASGSAPAKQPARLGYVTVNARPWVAVWVDGKKVASETPLRRYPLPVGSHTLRFQNGPADFESKLALEIREETIELFVDVKTGRIHRR